MKSAIVLTITNALAAIDCTLMIQASAPKPIVWMVSVPHRTIVNASKALKKMTISNVYRLMKRASMSQCFVIVPHPRCAIASMVFVQRMVRAFAWMAIKWPKSGRIVVSHYAQRNVWVEIENIVIIGFSQFKRLLMICVHFFHFIFV